VALDHTTGSEVWRSELDGDFVNVALLDADLYATANVELFCLDPATGDIRWKSPLKGLEFHVGPIDGDDDAAGYSVRQWILDSTHLQAQRGGHANRSSDASIVPLAGPHLAKSVWSHSSMVNRVRLQPLRVRRCIHAPQDTPYRFCLRMQT
jgi:outer membrane protein assembly factor BamB